MTITRTALQTTAAALALMLACTAQAITITPMTVTGPYAKTDEGAVKQSLDNPCIYGGSDCGSFHPADWPGWVDMPTGSSGTDSVTDLASLEYTAGYLIKLFGDKTLFDVGIDTNSAGDSPENLDLFQVLFDGAVYYEYDGGQSLHPSNQGTGWTDYILHSFSLAGLDPSTVVTFNLSMSGLGDGADSFYLIARNQEVPEPGTLALFGLGLAALGLLKLRGRA